MNTFKLDFGDVQSKRIKTPNDFISHMVEHIAWRLGCSIDLQWPNEDWRSLGSVLGSRIRSFTPFHQSAAALGMIDDGSAEVRMVLGKIGGHKISAGANIDLDDFLDGLTWGLGCSLVIHIKELSPPEDAWSMGFNHLGVALSEVFEINPYRKGVPPGVKANLS